MAVLYVAEFLTVGGTANHPVMGALTAPIAEQTVAIGGVSTPCTSAFNSRTNYVRVNVDSTCSIAFGQTPVATTGNMRMSAGQTEYFSVPPGASYKIAVISNT